MGRDALICRLSKKMWLYFPTKEATPRHYIGPCASEEELLRYLKRTGQ